MELALFDNLYFLDISGNYISFENMAYLPSLKDLNIGCNALTGISVPPDVPNAFAKLEVCHTINFLMTDTYQRC